MKQKDKGGKEDGASTRKAASNHQLPSQTILYVPPREVYPKGSVNRKGHVKQKGSVKQKGKCKTEREV